MVHIFFSYDRLAFGSHCGYFPSLTIQLNGQHSSRSLVQEELFIEVHHCLRAPAEVAQPIDGASPAVEFTVAVNDVFPVDAVAELHVMACKQRKNQRGESYQSKRGIESIPHDSDRLTHAIQVTLHSQMPVE